MNEAIKRGIKNFEDMPAAYPSIEDAIKYEVARYIWETVRQSKAEVSVELLDALEKITR